MDDENDESCAVLDLRLVRVKKEGETPKKNETKKTKRKRSPVDDAASRRKDASAQGPPKRARSFTIEVIDDDDDNFSTATPSTAPAATTKPVVKQENTVAKREEDRRNVAQERFMKGKEKDEEEENEGGTEAEEEDSTEQVRKMLGDKGLILRLDQHLAQTVKLLNDSPKIDTTKSYHEVINTAMNMIKADIQKNEKHTKNGKVDPIKTVFSEGRDPLYILQKIESERTVTFADVKNVERLMQDIPLETRSWIESMMRAPRLGERMCVNESDCVGMKLRNIPNDEKFILTQFHLRKEIEESNAQQKLLNPGRMCVLCVCMSHHRNFLYFLMTGHTAHPNAILQLFRVAEGKAGQYMPMNCVWLPIIPTKEYYGMQAPMPILTLDAFTTCYENTCKCPGFGGKNAEGGPKVVPGAGDRWCRYNPKRVVSGSEVLRGVLDLTEQEWGSFFSDPFLEELAERNEALRDEGVEEGLDAEAGEDRWRSHFSGMEALLESAEESVDSDYASARATDLEKKKRGEEEKKKPVGKSKGRPREGEERQKASAGTSGADPMEHCDDLPYRYQCPLAKVPDTPLRRYMTMRISLYERLIRLVRKIRFVRRHAPRGEGEGRPEDDGLKCEENPYSQAITALNTLMYAYLPPMNAIKSEGAAWRDARFESWMLPDASESPFFGDMPDFHDMILRVNFLGFKKKKNYSCTEKFKTRRKKSEVSKDSVHLYDMVKAMKHMIYNDFIHFVSKGLPMRCQVRSIIDAFVDIDSHDKTFVRFVRMLLVNTCLGLYPHCHFTPNFASSLTIHEYFIDVKSGETANTALRSWIEENRIFEGGSDVSGSSSSSSSSSTPTGKKEGWWGSVQGSAEAKHEKPKIVYSHQSILCFMIREFVMFAVQYIPSLRDVLSDTIGWGDFEENTFEACELMRRRFNANNLASRKIFVNVEQDMIFLKKKNIYPGSRAPFVDTVISVCDKVIVNELHPFRKHSERERMEWLSRDMEICNYFVLRMVRFLSRSSQYANVVPTIPEGSEALLRSLEAGSVPSCMVGILPVFAREIEAARIEYERSGKLTIIKTLVESRLQHILPEPEQENLRYGQFWMMYSFFSCLKIVYSISKAPQPLAYYEATLEAMRKEAKLPAGCDLDEEIMEGFRAKAQIGVCIHCKNVRSPVVTLFSEKKLFARGNNAIYDISSGNTYCVGKETTANDRKRGTKDTKVPTSYHNIRNINEIRRRIDRANAKKEIKIDSTTRCNHTPLIFIDLLGYVLEFFDDIYMLCPRCARITVFDKRFPYFDLYTCGCCKRVKSFLCEGAMPCVVCSTRDAFPNDTRSGVYVIEARPEEETCRLYNLSDRKDAMEEQDKAYPGLSVTAFLRYVESKDEDVWVINGETRPLPSRMCLRIGLCPMHNKKCFARAANNGDRVFYEDIVAQNNERIRRWNAESKARARQLAASSASRLSHMPPSQELD